MLGRYTPGYSGSVEQRTSTTPGWGQAETTWGRVLMAPAYGKLC